MDSNGGGGALEIREHKTPPPSHDLMPAPCPPSSRMGEKESIGSSAESKSRKRRVSVVLNEPETDTTKCPSQASKRQNRNEFSRDTHRALIAAIYEIGVRNASPVVLLENMVCNSEYLTSERVKSHLQKFRQNRDRGKEEFLSDYDRWMEKFTCSDSSENERMLASPAALVQLMNSGSLMAGEMAASLTACVLMDCHLSPITSRKRDHLSLASAESNVEEDGLCDFPDGASLEFPELTEAEQSSSIGRAMLHVEKLFTSLAAQLEIQRSKPDHTSIDNRSNEDGMAGAEKVRVEQGENLSEVRPVRTTPRPMSLPGQMSARDPSILPPLLVRPPILSTPPLMLRQLELQPQGFMQQHQLHLHQIQLRNQRRQWTHYGAWPTPNQYPYYPDRNPPG